MTGSRKLMMYVFAAAMGVTILSDVYCIWLDSLGGVSSDFGHYWKVINLPAFAFAIKTGHGWVDGSIPPFWVFLGQLIQWGIISLTISVVLTYLTSPLRKEK
jgi:hypothetical protein